MLCERVLQEQDGVLTLVRVVDRHTRVATGPVGEVPDEMPNVVVELTAAVILKPGDALGRYAIKIRPEKPSGQRLPAVEIPVHFEGGQGDRGVNIVLPVALEVDEEGLYWFDVLWSDERGGSEELLSRMPLRVIYQPQRLGPA